MGGSPCPVALPVPLALRPKGFFLKARQSPQTPEPSPCPPASSFAEISQTHTTRGEGEGREAHDVLEIPARALVPFWLWGAVRLPLLTGGTV